jgi:hypothetical protein
MTPDATAVLARIQAPTLEVRNRGGELAGRVSRSAAAELVAAGLASPVGRSSTKYLLLLSDEPTAARPWHGSSRTTYVERIPMHSGFAFITQHKTALKERR